MTRIIIILFLALLCYSQASAQINQDDTTSITSDSAFIKEQFILDSIATREKFVKDSLYHRKQILDSLTFLKQELPKLIEAAIKSINEEIIIYTDPVNIIGDSTLSNFTYRVLSQKLSMPYAPWRTSINLSESSFKIKIDTINKKIISVHSPEINYTFNYNMREKIVRMDGQSTVLKKTTGNYYKYPIDSAFFDREGRVKKLKKYVQYFEATSNYKKGALLYTDIEQIKEFDYFADGVLSNYRFINYCDRWGGEKINQVCGKVSYTVTRQAAKYTVIRKNEPENVYSEGTFIFEFDSNYDLKCMEYISGDKNLSRKCFIELNEDRNVSRYLFEKDGRINKTLLINYDNSVNAKNKVEIIECIFEEDGISYFQQNTTTGKSRIRNKLTMEWGPWK